MVPALNQQIGMQTQSFTQQWHYVMQCFRDKAMRNWSDPDLVSPRLNPLRCRKVGVAQGGASTPWARPTSLKTGLQVIDWIIRRRRYLSPGHYLAPTSGKKISISPPPERLATGESRSSGGHQRTPPSLPVILPICHFNLLFFTHTLQWIHALGRPSVRAVR